MANLVVYCLVLFFTVHGFLQCSVTAHDTQWVVDVRLTGGSNSYSGTLQLRSLTPPTDWQDFSCGSRIYDSRVFAVACRMLGFENIVHYSWTTISNSGNFISISQNCRGTETDINDCSGSYSYTTHCRYRYEVLCSTCVVGAVRLTNGLVPVQGIVEICLNGSWSRVCGVHWDYQESLVVCRQLGYLTSKLEYSINTNIDTHTGYILSNFNYTCVGNESRLYDCNREINSTCELQHSVGELRAVILSCMVQTPVTSCINGTIRLSGGRDQYEGRVEVCSNGLWVIISRSGWDSNDAKVACRQLGLLQPHTLTRITIPSFSLKEGSIYFNNLRCNGYEDRLIDCRKSSYYDFWQYSSAGVRCQFNPSLVHNFCNGDVRLVGGNSVSEGRVEMCYNGVWGSICIHGWDNSDAGIVCRQLGFQGENSTAIHDQRYGEGSGPYLLSYVNCRGHEQNLTECPSSQIGFHRCSSKQDAGVICDGRKATCDHGDVRLYGGYSKSDGLAEICINGQWTKICYHGWNETYSIKFCRQLLGRENVVAPYSTCCKRDLSTSISSLHNVRCNPPSPARLVDCSYSISNSSCSRLIVGCYVNDSCANESMRLVNGTTMFDGIVEVCLNGVWGNIISYGWNTPDAEVVCRQLGLSWRWSQYYDVRRRYDAHYSPHWLRYVNCVGSEDTLFNCTYTKASLVESLYYLHASIAAVLCQGSAHQSNFPNKCISGEVRLANSSNNIEGRVEICTEGMWVSVCDRYWGRVETHLFCKQLLGHPVKGSFPRTGGYYGTGNSPIISRVNCYDYNSFNSCTITHQGRCSHGREVGVVCQDDSADSDYVITVTTITDPPFEPGSNLKLHCSISPDPSVGQAVRLYYYWRGNNGQFSQYSSSPNLTRLVTVTHYKESYYYCEVHFKGLIIGVGSILIQITDILNPIEVFSPSDGQTFNLSVNATDEIQFIARELNWYINGILTTNSYYNVLTNGNKTLITTVGSPGVYEVRYDGLLALPYNRECEKMLLSGMRHYPMLRPVRFPVNTTEKVVPLYNTITILSDNVFTHGDNITLRVVGQTSLFIEPRTIRITWLINGRRRGSFSSGKIYGEIVRTDATYLFAGRYEVLLLWNIGYSQQCSQYYNSLRQQTPFDLYQVILAKSSIELKYYESLNHSFTTTKPSLSSSEVSLLSCSATIRYPPLTSISIVKNKIILKTKANTSLTVSTDSLGVSPFGSYQCRVNATGVVFTQQLTIKEKVSLRLELNIKESSKCSKDDDFVEVMESSIATKLNNDCSCNFTTDDLEDTLIECNSESSMIFTTLLVFSTESGDETASTLANRLFQQVSFSGLAIGINGSEAQITSACSDDCYQSIGRNNLDSVGIKIGVFFGGVIFSAVFTALCIKLFMMFRRKSLNKRSSLTVPKKAMKNIKSERSTNINTFGENALYVVKAENRREFTNDLYDIVEDTPQDNMDEVCKENLSYAVSKQRTNFKKFT